MAFNDLLQSNMFRQLLAGTAIGIDPTGVGGMLGKGAMNQISAQNYSNLLQQMLGGLPAGAKMTGDNQNLNIKMPVASMTNPVSGEQLAQPTQNQTITNPVSGQALPLPTGAGTGIQSQAQQSGINQNNLLGNLLGGLFTSNPSASPLGNLTPEDLVGLTPEMITQAVGLGLQKQKMDMTNATNLAKLSAKNAAAPLQLPGVGTITADQWKSLDTKTKGYAYYVFDERRRGDEPLPYNEWSRQIDTPMLKQLFELASTDEVFNEWLKDYRKAGATTVTNVLERELEKGKAKSIVRLSTGELNKDIDKVVNDPQFEFTISTKAEEAGVDIDDPVAFGKFKDREIYNMVEDNIVGAGGTITNRRASGNTIIWTVKDDSGNTFEVKRAF